MDASQELDQLRAEITELRKRINADRMALMTALGRRDVLLGEANPAEDKTQAIQQGVKSQVRTVPMPVRLGENQLRAMKILAAVEGTTVSQLIRSAIHHDLFVWADMNPAFEKALEAAGVEI